MAVIGGHDKRPTRRGAANGVILKEMAEITKLIRALPVSGSLEVS